MLSRESQRRSGRRCRNLLYDSLGRSTPEVSLPEDSQCFRGSCPELQPARDCFPTAKCPGPSWPKVPPAPCPSRRSQELPFYAVSLSDEARLCAIAETRNIRAVTNDDDRGQTKRKIKKNRRVQVPKPEHCADCDGQSQSSRDGSDRNVASSFKRQDPNRGHN